MKLKKINVLSYALVEFAFKQGFIASSHWGDFLLSSEKWELQNTEFNFIYSASHIVKKIFKKRLPTNILFWIQLSLFYNLGYLSKIHYIIWEESEKVLLRISHNFTNKKARFHEIVFKSRSIFMCIFNLMILVSFIFLRCIFNFNHCKEVVWIRNPKSFCSCPMNINFWFWWATLWSFLRSPRALKSFSFGSRESSEE